MRTFLVALAPSLLLALSPPLAVDYTKIVGGDPVPWPLTNVTSISVVWSPPGSDATISKYEIRIDGGDWLNAYTSPSYTITGLDPAQTVSVEVRAVSSDGTGDPSSPPVEFTSAPSRKPNAPYALCGSKARHTKILPSRASPQLRLRSRSARTLTFPFWYASSRSLNPVSNM